MTPSDDRNLISKLECENLWEQSLQLLEVMEDKDLSLATEIMTRLSELPKPETTKKRR